MKPPPLRPDASFRGSSRQAQGVLPCIKTLTPPPRAGKERAPERALSRADKRKLLNYTGAVAWLL